MKTVTYTIIILQTIQSNFYQNNFFLHSIREIMTNGSVYIMLKISYNLSPLICKIVNMTLNSREKKKNRRKKKQNTLCQ